jgi:hypothetical protein
MENDENLYTWTFMNDWSREGAFCGKMGQAMSGQEKNVHCHVLDFSCLHWLYLAGLILYYFWLMHKDRCILSRK